MESDSEDSLLDADLSWLGARSGTGQAATLSTGGEEATRQPVPSTAELRPDNPPGDDTALLVDLTSDTEAAGPARAALEGSQTDAPGSNPRGRPQRQACKRVYDQDEDDASGQEGAGLPDDPAEEQSVSPPKMKKGKRQAADPAARNLDREEKKLLAAEEKQRKAAERQAAKEARAAAKEAEKHVKKCEKEAALRLKGSGKRAEQDMRVLLDRQIPTHPCCRDVITYLAREGLNAAISPGDHPLAPRASVLWRRAVPMRDGRSETLQDIPYVLVVLSPEQFIEEVDAGELTSLLHASAAAHPGYTLGLLIVGLDHYLTTRERRDFRRDVSVTAGAFIRQPYDSAVASLAIRWPGVRHHLVPDAAAAAERIMLLTKGLAQQPHKGAASFLDSFGGPKRDTTTAKEVLAQCPIEHPDRQTTFYALSYVPDVGPQIAHSLTGRFPSLGSLMAYFLDPSRDQNAKEKELANMPRALGGSRVGPSAVRKLHALLTTDDPYKPVKSLTKE